MSLALLFHHLLLIMFRMLVHSCQWVNSEIIKNVTSCWSVFIQLFSFILLSSVQKLSLSCFPFVLHIFACKIKSLGKRFHCVYNCKFLSTGASRAALADSFRHGISHITHYIIKEVCEAIWKTVAPLHMPVPTTEMLLATSNEFYLMCNFSYACTYNRNATCDVKRVLSYV